MKTRHSAIGMDDAWPDDDDWTDEDREAMRTWYQEVGRFLVPDRVRWQEEGF